MKGIFLFNDALNTFYLWLYGVRHMAKDHSVVEHWLERDIIAQWVHPMKDRSDDPSYHEQMLLPRSYVPLPWSVN